MANDVFSGVSSAFDDLREKSRKEWDALAPASGLTLPRPTPQPAGGSSRPSVPPAAVAGAAGAAGPATAAGRGEVLRRTGEHASAARVWDAARSEAAAFLFNRFGPEWQGGGGGWGSGAGGVG